MMRDKTYFGMAVLLVASCLIGAGCGKTALKENNKAESTELANVSSVVAIAENALEPSEEQPFALVGELWEATIGPGNYRIGTDIPMGVMNLRVLSGNGHISSSDGTLDVDMTEGAGTESLTEGDWLAKEIMATAEQGNFPDLESVDTLTDEEMQNILAMAENGTEETVSYFNNVGFEKDVMINVGGSLRIRFESDNCDVAGMKKRSLIGEAFAFGEGTFTAGKDFDSGTYNITVTEGIGSVKTGDGSMFVYMGYPAEPGINSDKYMNLSVADGGTVVVEGVQIEMQRVSD